MTSEKKKKRKHEEKPKDEASQKQPVPEEEKQEQKPAEQATESAAEATTDALSKQVELEQAREDLLRVAAEFANYRRRVERDVSTKTRRVLEELALDILEVIDDFERALENAVQHAKNNPEEFIKGVRMIYDRLWAVLKKRGVDRIEAEGRQFDPFYHEAMMHAASDEHPPGTVSSEFKPGYTLQERVLRPSLVAVSSGTAQQEKDTESEQNDENNEIKEQKGDENDA